MVKSWEATEGDPIRVNDDVFKLYVTNLHDPVFVSVAPLNTQRHILPPELSLYRNLFTDMGLIVLETKRAYVQGKWIDYTSPLNANIPVAVVHEKDANAHPEAYEARIHDQYGELRQRSERVLAEKVQKLALLQRTLGTVRTKASKTERKEGGLYDMLQDTNYLHEMIRIIQKEETQNAEFLAEYNMVQ